MRILQVSRSLTRAGAETMAVELAAGLKDRGHQVQLVLLERPIATAATLRERVERCGLQTHELRKRAGADPTAVVRLARLVRTFRPHLVHTHGMGLPYALPGTFASRRRPRRVHTVHCLAQHELPSSMQGVIGGLMRTGHVLPVAISEAVATSIANVYGVASPAIVRNGIDLHALAPSAGPAAAWREAQGVPSNASLILSVGRLRREKGHRVLIEALRQLDTDLRPVQAFLIGDGPEHRGLTDLIHRYGLSDRVRLLGARTDIPQALHAADLLVHPSLHEGLGLAIMEAQAVGVPIIASRTGGIVELIEHGQTGVLVEPGDPRILAEALQTALRAPAAMATQARRAQEKARKSYGTTAMVSAYDALYRANPPPWSDGSCPRGADPGP